MHCPTLTELPAAPAGTAGWPWTEESLQLPEHTPEGGSWPLITIVTPSYNQGRFIEETIRSILLQGYPNLEYFVIDGGSTDNTIEIIKRYSEWIDFWVSEPDGGQSAAINRGLKMGSGSLATWINSDDMLCKNALFNHLMSQELAEDVVYIGDCVNIDEVGNVLFKHRGRVQSLEDLINIRSVWRSGGYICQQEVLFPLQLALRVGGLNEENHYSMDYELWGKFFLAGAKVQYTGIPFGFFRWHKGQKTQENIKQNESMLDAAIELIALQNSLPPEAKQEIVADLQAYRKAYPIMCWRQSGRLARIGLPPSIVVPIRNLRYAVEKTLSDLMRSTK
jgi:glycosyltransferase involved in cell wall biosynthesis